MEDIESLWTIRDRDILQIGISLGQSIKNAKSAEIPTIFSQYRQRWRDRFPGEPLPRLLATNEEK